MLGARTVRLPSLEAVDSELKATNYDEAIDFAEGIYRSLPDGQYLIEIWDSHRIWEFETRLHKTWKDGVPMREF